jgi:hypothetical protein
MTSASTPRPSPIRALTWTTTASLSCAVLGAVLARAIGHVCLSDVPHVMDEIAYLLQAKTFALGRLFTPPAIPRAAFNMWFVEDRCARFSIFPPGWPAVLALGVKLGAIQCVNPILHGLTAWLVGAVARRFAGGVAQVVTTALYALSPQALLLASSLMSHALIAACAAVVLAACVDCLLSERPSPLRGVPWGFVGAGAAIGVAATTRPLCACALLIAFCGGVIYAKMPLRQLAWALVPVALCTLALAAYNAKLTDSPARFPQSAYFDEHLPPADLPVFKYHPGCNDLGFGASHGCDYSIRGGAHDLMNALSNTGDNLQAWFLLAGGGPLVFLALGYGLLDRGERSRRAVLLLPALSAIALYALYWYAGTCFGARFYHAGLPALLLVAALGVWSLRSPAARVVVVAVWLAWNAYAVERSSSELKDGYWGTDDRFAQLASHWDKPPALVMVAFPAKLVQMHTLHWTAPLVRDGHWLNSIRALGALGANSPTLDGPVVFAKFHQGLVDELRESFAGRTMWIYFAEVDRTKDRLVPYDPTVLPLDEPKQYPADNFDGYEYDGESRPDTKPNTD